MGDKNVRGIFLAICIREHDKNTGRQLLPAKRLREDFYLGLHQASICMYIGKILGFRHVVKSLLAIVQPSALCVARYMLKNIALVAQTMCASSWRHSHSRLSLLLEPMHPAGDDTHLRASASRSTATPEMHNTHKTRVDPTKNMRGARKATG